MIIPTGEFGRWPHWTDDKSWDTFLREVKSKWKYREDEIFEEKKRLLWDLCDSSPYHHLYPTTCVKSVLHYPLRTSETSEYFRLSGPGVFSCPESGTVLKSKRFLREINKTKERKKKKNENQKLSKQRQLGHAEENTNLKRTSAGFIFCALSIKPCWSNYYSTHSLGILSNFFYPSLHHCACLQNTQCISQNTHNNQQQQKEPAKEVQRVTAKW